jgi:hypothetical protein
MQLTWSQYAIHRPVNMTLHIGVTKFTQFLQEHMFSVLVAHQTMLELEEVVDFVVMALRWKHRDRKSVDASYC